MRRRPAILGLSLLACALWTAFVALAALHGFWRHALTGSDDPADFLAAAHEAVPDTFRGNLVAIVLDAGDPVAEIGIGPDGAVPDRNSVFQIASLSKWVTAVGVLALVERGAIGLDDPVEDHLARWRFPDSRFDSREVTIRRLLSHTGGLTDGLGYNGFASPADVQSLEASLDGAADAMDGTSGWVEIGIHPGGRFAYSGGGYTVLQLMVEDVTGQSFADAMAELVLDPIGMTASSFLDPDVATIAPVFDTGGQRIPPHLYAAKAAASLYTTAGDLAAFLAAVHRPRADGGLLGPDMRAAMVNPEARIFGVPIWGLGATLYMMDRQGSAVIGHDGRNAPAINTAPRLDVKNGAGIVVLATGTQDLASEIANEWVYWLTRRPAITAVWDAWFLAGLAWSIGLACIGVLALRVLHAARYAPHA